MHTNEYFFPSVTESGSADCRFIFIAQAGDADQCTHLQQDKDNDTKKTKDNPFIISLDLNK